MTYTYRPVNLSGIRWRDQDGQLAGFGTGRPGFGIQCVETGQVIARNGTPSVWNTKSAAAYIAEHAASLVAESNGKWEWAVVILPSVFPARQRALWSAPHSVHAYEDGKLCFTERNVKHSDAWSLAAPWLTREMRDHGFTATVTPEL